MSNNAVDTAGTITSVQAESTLDISSNSASESDLPQSAEEPTVVKTKVSILLCGNAKLDSEGVVGKLHVAEQLGRRKLKSDDFDADAYVGKADVLWLAPKKHWTVSRTEASLQERTNKLTDSFLQHGKDVVIVTDKDFRFKQQDPSEKLHRHETPGHIVLCSVKLTKLNQKCGDNDSEQHLNSAIASCLKKTLGRVGVRQSYKSDKSYKGNHDDANT